jgi:hypothetical protein
MSGTLVKKTKERHNMKVIESKAGTNRADTARLGQTAAPINSTPETKLADSFARPCGAGRGQRLALAKGGARHG